MYGEEEAGFNENSLQVVEQVSKIYDMTVAQQKERKMKAEGLSNDMVTSGSDGFLRFAYNSTSFMQGKGNLRLDIL